MSKNSQTLKTLFTSSFYLSSFTFGGGYAIIPLLHKKFVDELHWIEEDEMLNLAAIGSSSPGAIVVNVSILLGYKIAGIIGAIVTVLGTILPPLIIISIISLFYNAFRNNEIVATVLKGMQAGVAAVIANAVFNLIDGLTKEKDVIAIFVMIFAFLAAFYFKINVAFIIIACAIIGAIRTLYSKKEVM